MKKGIAILCFEFKATDAANEALFGDVSFYGVAFISHICEGVDYDTEDQIQKQNRDYTEECQVKRISLPIEIRIFFQ